METKSHATQGEWWLPPLLSGHLSTAFRAAALTSARVEALARQECHMKN